MTTLVLADNAYGTLGGSLIASDTTLNFTSGHGSRFPNVPSGSALYCCILNSNNVLEEIIITLHTAGADTATITRAAGGTTAKAWNVGDRIEARISKAVLDTKAAAGPLADSGITGAAAVTYVDAQDALKAALAGSSSQQFSVADATSAQHALSLSQAIGAGSTTIASPVRTFETNYTNSSDRPLFVSITCALGPGGTLLTLLVGGATIQEVTNANANSQVLSLCTIVPPGAVYRLNRSDAISFTLRQWTEY